MLLRNWRIAFLGLAAVLLLAACGNQATPEPTPTRTPRPTFTPTPQGQVANNQLFQTPTLDPNQPTATEEVILPTDTPAPPTDTPIPVTDTPAPTPEPTVQPAAVFSGQVVNVRSGPGTSYGLIGRMNAGQRYPVTGKNPDGSWWQIDYSGQTGWVTGSLVTTEGAIDAVQVATNIPVAPTRPPAQPTPVPQPTSPPAVQPTAAPSFAFTLGKGVERCDPNPGTTYFEGFVRDRNNNLVNGACVHIAFYGPRNTKCSGCDGVGDGKWGFSPFGGPAPTGTPVEIFVVQCPSGGMPAGGQTQASGFGSLTPLSEKFTRTISQSEQCTGITFYRN